MKLDVYDDFFFYFLQRLLELRVTNTGRLFGVMSDNSLTVLGFAVNPVDDDEGIEPAALQLNMPVEIDLCGVLFIGDCKEEIPDAFKVTKNSFNSINKC